MVTLNKETADDRIADILLRGHRVNTEAIEEARNEAHETGSRLGDVLLQNEMVTNTDMALALAEYVRMRPIELANYSIEGHLLDLVPKEIMIKHNLMPIARHGRQLTLALGDPFDVVGIDKVRDITGLNVTTVVAAEKQVTDLLQRFTQDSSAGLEDILQDINDSDVELGLEEVDDASLDEMLEGAEDAPVIRIVNSIMVEAIRKKASDIHVEAMEKSLRLRYRIDGVLYESPCPPKSLQSAIISRIKIMSNLDIAERRVPQDGRFKIRALGKECDIRVSLLPTVHGEKVVMRILDKSALAPSVSSLGLDQKAYDDLMYGLGQPHGMILVTGPTGSGKTTTLYSGLQELNDPRTNIITTEDPVEYQLSGINQVQVHADVGLTFAASLRSILRQDPDIVMVGEIRDGETASIAVQAALTGHLVLSTLHTNDAAGAVARLLYMGIEGFLLASSLVLTQAQRLYRKLCPSCKRSRAIPADIMELNSIDPSEFDGIEFFEPRGCPKCSNTGYRGRGAIMEILLVDDQVRECILREDNAATIRQVAVENGMNTLRETGLLRVREGITSVEEVVRITGGD